MGHDTRTFSVQRAEGRGRGGAGGEGHKGLEGHKCLTALTTSIRRRLPFKDRANVELVRERRAVGEQGREGVQRFFHRRAGFSPARGLDEGLAMPVHLLVPLGDLTQHDRLPRYGHVLIPPFAPRPPHVSDLVELRTAFHRLGGRPIRLYAQVLVPQVWLCQARDDTMLQVLLHGSEDQKRRVRCDHAKAPRDGEDFVLGAPVALHRRYAPLRPQPPDGRLAVGRGLARQRGCIHPQPPRRGGHRTEGPVVGGHPGRRGPWLEAADEHEPFPGRHLLRAVGVDVAHSHGAPKALEPKRRGHHPLDYRLRLHALRP
mmetsp:Transcript_102552/g.289645  ORF Transcript_102552/g.289645 Transcript_102552/m.289645 type:complete len:315 (+) Transcript_102552:2349-3293(+)